MGLHICPYILKEKVVGDYGSTYWETEELADFDHLRHSGDEFVSVFIDNRTYHYKRWPLMDDYMVYIVKT